MYLNVASGTNSELFLSRKINFAFISQPFRHLRGGAIRKKGISQNVCSSNPVYLSTILNRAKVLALYPIG